MAQFVWDADLETGQTEIDKQHRGLFALANRLEDALAENVEDEDAIADAIYGLTDYVVEHFYDEEALMAETGYPALGSHRGLHEQLTSDTMGFAARYFNGETVAAEKIAPFVAKWLREHITGADMQFVRWVKNH